MLYSGQSIWSNKEIGSISAEFPDFHVTFQFYKISRLRYLGTRATSYIQYLPHNISSTYLLIANQDFIKTLQNF